MEKKSKWNINTFYTVAAIYIAFVLLSWIYFFLLQGFGSQGFVFDLSGEDHIFNIFDAMLLVATVASFFLLAISLLAFRKRKDKRLFVLTIAFFLFAAHEVLHFLENFFPGEQIFAGNAERALELLVLLSLIVLLYIRKW